MDGGGVKKSVWTLFMGDSLYCGSITQLKFVKKLNSVMKLLPLEYSKVMNTDEGGKNKVFDLTIY